MSHKIPWPAAVALAVRLTGLAVVTGVIVYMSSSYLSGQYLRDDPVLTLIAIMLFVVGAVFAVYCTAAEFGKRLKENRKPTK